MVLYNGLKRDGKQCRREGFRRGIMKHTKHPAYSVGILAGGKSTRMGQNKALMEFQNETMIGRISKEFRGFGEVLVSASQRGIYEAEGLRVVYDEADSIGPIEGIRQLISQAGEEYIFICAADMPFVNREIAEYLAEFLSSDFDCFVITDEEHVHPLCAIYSKRVLPVVEELIREKKYRLVEILNRVRTKYVSLTHTNFDRRIVKNVNTKDEFLALSLPVIFAVSGYHNSGKTGLIEKLINEFIREGYTVGVLKHDGQDHIDEAEGTDTARLRKAGAMCTAVVSDTRCIFDVQFVKAGGEAAGSGEAGEELRQKMSDVRSPETLIRQMKDLPEPPSVIILEGFKNSVYPKIEVVRREVFPESVADPDTLICIVTDCISPEKVSCPVFGSDDIRGIFSCLRERFSI